MKNKQSWFDRTFEGSTKSEWFWNGFAYLATIIITLIDWYVYHDWQAFPAISVIASIIMVVNWMDGRFDKDSSAARHLWLGLACGFWFFMFVGGIIFFFAWVYEKPIVKFNEWLDYKGDWDRFSSWMNINEQHELTLEFRKGYKDHDYHGKKKYYESDYKYWDKKFKIANPLKEK